MKAKADTTAIRESYRKSLHTLSTQGFCDYGNYPWDAWQSMALLRGVPKELAGLGREIMREAYQHAWSERLRLLCGWGDEGRRMMVLALRAPETARRRWEWLMETDGQRVDPGANYEWVGEDCWRWPQRRRRWLKAQRSGKES